MQRFGTRECYMLPWMAFLPMLYSTPIPPRPLLFLLSIGNDNMIFTGVL